MSGFYRYGTPGQDTVAHINTGRRSSGERCRMPRFPEDNPQFGDVCGRMSVALCDAVGCDKPICELHRTKHPTKPNTDFCPDHSQLANPQRAATPVRRETAETTSSESVDQGA